MQKLAAWDSILALANSLAIIIIIIIVLVPSRTHCSRFSERIINGNETRPGEFPFVAVVHIKKDMFICTGSILDERHVLTAGHCFYDDDNKTRPGRPMVRFGCHNRIKCSDLYPAKLILHPQFTLFKYAGYLYDLAILRMDQPIKFNELTGEGAVNSIKLPESVDNDYVVGQNLTAMGWGTTKHPGSNPFKLRQASLRTRSLAKCRAHYPLLDESVVCAGGGGESTTATCSGDSGGPLIRTLADGTHVLVAVTSYSDDCSLEFGGVMMRVATSLDWIRNTMAEVPDEGDDR